MLYEQAQELRACVLHARTLRIRLLTGGSRATPCHHNQAAQQLQLSFLAAGSRAAAGPPTHQSTEWL